MSFSETFRGQVSEVQDQVRDFPAKLEAQDKQYGASEGVVEGHKKQATQACAEASTAIATLPEGTAVEVGVWGHANSDQSGSFGWRCNVNDRPTPTA